jgi:hypothetical protein
MKPHVPPYRANDHVSPFPQAFTPASDIMAATPPSERQSVPFSQNRQSPWDASSPINALSPTTTMVVNTAKIERAGVFLQGRHMQLLEGMSTQEKREATPTLHVKSFKFERN